MDPRRQATADASAARGQLYGEQAQTEQALRGPRVSTEMAKTGAAASLDAARRATEALTQQRTATETARTGSTQALGELHGAHAEELRQKMKGTQAPATQTIPSAGGQVMPSQAKDFGAGPGIAAKIMGGQPTGELATGQMTGKGPVETQGALPGLEDVWDKFDDGEREELLAYADKAEAAGKYREWIAKVRSMAK